MSPGSAVKASRIVATTWPSSRNSWRLGRNRVSTGKTPHHAFQLASAGLSVTPVSLTFAEASSISISTSAIWEISVSVIGRSFFNRTQFNCNRR